MKKCAALIFFYALLMNYGLSQCNVIYVTPSGTGAGLINDPANLDSALILAVSGDVLKLDTGLYELKNPLELKDSITIEGGYDYLLNWTKTSLKGATKLRRDIINPELSPNRITAIKGFNLSGFRLQDLSIEIQNTNVLGQSLYGIYLDSCTNYNIVRCAINVGVAGNGADGISPSGVGGAGPGGQGGSGGSSNQGCNANGANGANGAPGFGGTPGGNGGGGANGQGCNIFGCNAGPENGNGGSVGNAGANGASASQTPPTSTISFPYFIPDASSVNGADGNGGGGGGGGGGMSKGTDCTCSYFGSGNGGSGGTGGSGGLGGTAGSGAGGSFAIYLYRNNGGNIQDVYIELNGVSIGGIGGIGQPGGVGANGGSSQNAGCGGSSANSGPGGNGGNGGNGGDGQPGANGLNEKIVIDGTPPSMIQGDSLLTLVLGVNNPLDFDLGSQPEIHMENVFCAFEDVIFESDSSLAWEFGSASNNQVQISSIATVQYNQVGRFDVIFSSTNYAGFANMPFLTTIADAGLDQLVCDSLQSDLNGNLALNDYGVWSSLGSASVDDSSLNTSGISNLSVGDNLFVWTITSSCCPNSSDTVNVKVGISTSATISDTALDSYSLNGQNYTQSGTYNQILTNSSGCDSTITLELVVNYTGLNDNQVLPISIYPNPASDKLFLIGLDDLEGKVEIKLYDFKGAVIKDIDKREMIDVSSLSKGLYYLQIEYKKVKSSHRFIKK